MNRNHKLCSLVCLAVASLASVGCQMPGGTVGMEPIDFRFAQLQQRALEAEAVQIDEPASYQSEGPIASTQVSLRGFN